ncbi:hypothetical protein LTR01_009260, partial [Friedmanniomyces endolithicus]
MLASSKSILATKLWTCHHTCQRFFKVGKWQRYFQVTVHGLDATTEETACQRDDFFRSQKADIAQAERDATEDANRVRGFDDHRSVVVPWLRETGIVDHVRGLKKNEIRAAITIPSPSDDSALRQIIDATDSMLREAHRWCFDGPHCMLTWPCRVVLGRFQSSQNESFGKIRPFDPYKEPGTLQTYIGLAHRALAYFDRVAAGDEDFFSEETEEGTKPEDIVQPSEEQLVAWKDIRTLAGCKPRAEQEAEKDRLK